MRMFLFLLIPAIIHAEPWSARINTATAGSVVGLSYSTAASSLVLTGIRGGRTIMVDNRQTSVPIAVNCSASASTAPASTSSKNLYVNAGGTLTTPVFSMGNACFLRADPNDGASVISSGIITIMVYPSN